jgi:hypothetical protein
MHHPILPNTMPCAGFYKTAGALKHAYACDSSYEREHGGKCVGYCSTSSLAKEFKAIYSVWTVEERLY